MKRVSFNYKGRKIFLSVHEVGFFGKIIGLMFKSRKNAKALLFDFKRSTRLRIHSIFVFFPFIAVWLNKKNKVVKLKKISCFIPFIDAGKSFYKLVEIPINKKYEAKINKLGIPRR